MKIHIAEDIRKLGEWAAGDGAAAIRSAITDQGYANIIVATGASQFQMLEALTKAHDIDWQKVTAFHLDEYIGIGFGHPASFRNYLWKRFASQLPMPLAAFYFLNGDNDPELECHRVGEILLEHPIDVAFVGIGENGHLAFNDPPADFETQQPYISVALDEACRQQQASEGWFASIDDVPTHAISMSIQQIMKSQQIICTVPDARKALAVRNSVEGEVSPAVPASILQRHRNVSVYLDPPAAALLPMD